MSRTVIVNVHWAVKFAYNLVIATIPAHVSAKTVIFSDNGASFMRETIGADRLEEKYGGNLPNKNEEYWPPRYNP